MSRSIIAFSAVALASLVFLKIKTMKKMPNTIPGNADEIVGKWRSQAQDSEMEMTKTVPDWLVHFAGLFSAQAKSGSMFRNVNRNISNDKARNVLGWTPIATNEQAIIASLESMIKYGIVK